MMSDYGATTDSADLRSDFNRLRADLASLTKTVGDISQRRAAAGADTLEWAGDYANESLQAVAAKAGSLRNAGLEATARQVAGHPLSSLLIAFSAGLLAGKLADRR
jgi:ElaB/YqjD/DUF883 family membrane-anchored ribosome-binding protein